MPNFTSKSFFVRFMNLNYESSKNHYYFGNSGFRFIFFYDVAAVVKHFVIIEQ